jgi:hypothetical protein
MKKTVKKEIKKTKKVKNLKVKKTSSKKQYYIVRTCNAGVFAGYIEKKKDSTVIMNQARRIWYWSGASSLSELSVKGVSQPEECKFPCKVDEIELFEVIEILKCTKEAQSSIENVPVWTSF